MGNVSATIKLVYCTHRARGDYKVILFKNLLQRKLKSSNSAGGFVGWLYSGFNVTLTAKVISWRSVTHMCFLAFSHQYEHNLPNPGGSVVSTSDSLPYLVYLVLQIILGIASLIGFHTEFYTCPLPDSYMWDKI